MGELTESVSRTLTDVRPLVRPAYNQFEVVALPPWGDPEVHVPSEVGTYFVTALFFSLFIEFFQAESHGR